MTDARHAKRIRRAAGALLEGRGRWRQELAPTGLVRRGGYKRWRQRKKEGKKGEVREEEGRREEKN